MSTPQIRELDIKIDAKAKELKHPLINQHEKLIKTKELVKLFEEQNELLNQLIETNKRLWKQQQLMN